MRRELLALCEREPDHRVLGQVVERRESVVLGVVFAGAVGHLDHEPTGPANEQRQREVARDQVRVDRQAEHPEAVLEVVLPDRLVPLEQALAAPDVVDEHVQAAVLGVDAPDELRDLCWLEMVDRDGDPHAPGVADELGGLLDRLGPVVLRAPLPRRAAGAVHDRPCLPERDGRPTPGTTGCARNERHLSGERTRHRTHPTTTLVSRRPRGSGRSRPASSPRTWAAYGCTNASASSSSAGESGWARWTASGATSFCSNGAATSSTRPRPR